MRNLFSKLEAGTGPGNQGSLEVMGLQYFILPFTLLGTGIVLSVAVWIIEKLFLYLGARNLLKENPKHQLGILINIFDCK